MGTTAKVSVRSGDSNEQVLRVMAAQAAGGDYSRVTTEKSLGKTAERLKKREWVSLNQDQGTAELVGRFTGSPILIWKDATFIV